MLEKAKDFLYEIDFFGVSVSLRLDGEPSANTILGGLLSLCLSIGLTVTFFNFAQDLIYKRNPSIATETRYLDQRPNITFLKMHFQLLLEFLAKAPITLTRKAFSLYQLKFYITITQMLNLR